MECKNCKAALMESDTYCEKCGTKNKPSILDNWTSVFVEITPRKNVNVNPLDYEKLSGVALETLREKKYYEALEYYNYIIKNEIFKVADNKILAEVHNNLSCCYSGLNDKLSELRHLNIALEYNPSYFFALKNRAYLKIHLDDNVGALIDINTIRRNGEMNPFVWYALGIASENLNQLDSAEEAYKEAIKGGIEKAESDLQDVLKKKKEVDIPLVHSLTLEKAFVRDLLA